MWLNGKVDSPLFRTRDGNLSASWETYLFFEHQITPFLFFVMGLNPYLKNERGYVILDIANTEPKAVTNRLCSMPTESHGYHTRRSSRPEAKSLF